MAARPGHRPSPGRGKSVVGVRDSKDPSGPALAFEPTSWRAFVAQVAARG
ncbi:DUF397 domain-containing protein [Micromonospora robiginosa]|uniref:DUF397 domain-containing protein n=1 Tax=Micromonospora robiginosa TaxID=2749844 RepID=A0AAF0P301_9ACTN|nr:DUF397 domain-containing protein [Micromonospora ferruginea]WMF04564.1 DUF397 domain-containing protein [Micromonospora ferruginea]